MERMANDINILLVDSKKAKMIKIYCIVCNKYRKFKNPKISSIFEKNIRSFYCLQ